NRDLPAEVEARRFRQDLFYRLNVMRIRLSPLRERRDDIPALVDHFVGRYGNDHRIPDEIMNTLVEHDWPGNIRELEHTIQQMVVMNSDPCWLSSASLPSTFTNRKLEHDITTAESLGNLHSSLNSYYPQPVTPLADVEKKAILNAIDYTKGDRTIAA